MNIEKPLIEHVLYPLMEKRRGNTVREKVRELQSTERLGTDELRKRQTAALTELLLHCAEHVPAYRESGLTADGIRSDPWGSLAKIEPLSKEAFRERPDDFLADNIPQSARIANHTGGSTGLPLCFFMSRDQVERYEAARWRGLGWYGITFGSRSIMVWGNPVELSANAQKKEQLRERLLKNRQILSAYTLSEQYAPEYLKLLNRYKPEYLYGYSSALAEFARILKPHRERLKVRLKAVVSTSEILFPWQSEIIGETFECPVVDEYGARDAGILAYACPEGRLHITAENAIIEVLSPVTLEPLPPGREGVLAVTDLYSRVQPRLRYLLGDVGAVSQETCSCGLGLPILETLVGRENTMLVGPNGELVHGTVVSRIAQAHAGVKGYRFVQTTESTGVLYLVTEQDAHAAEEIAAEIGRVLPNVEITTQLVDKIEPSASGKMSYVVREFDLPK